MIRPELAQGSFFQSLGFRVSFDLEQPIGQRYCCSDQASIHIGESMGSCLGMIQVSPRWVKPLHPTTDVLIEGIHCQLLGREAKDSCEDVPNLNHSGTDVATPPNDHRCGEVVPCNHAKQEANSDRQ